MFDRLQSALFARPDPRSEAAAALRAELHGLFLVEGVSLGSPLVFSGRYLGDASGYEELRLRFLSHGFTPLLRRQRGQDRLLAVEGTIPAGRTGNPLVNLLLFVLTVLTTLSAGATMAGETGLFVALRAGATGELWTAVAAGAPFAVTLLGILGVHELGHYLAARWHGVTASLPYFIPLPAGGLGTLGAFISVRSPMINRIVLFDIGLAGPLAGLVVALPLFVVGLLLSQPVPLFAPGMTLRVLGDSILTSGLLALLTDLPAGQTLAPHPIYFAAWIGILITGINLLPIGQLDGGHVAYALLGKRAHWIARGALVLLLAAGLVLSSTWLVWALFVLFGGLHHAPPLDDITPLTSSRRTLGWLAAVLFFLIVTPIPFRG